MLPQQIKISDAGLAPPTIAKITRPTAFRLTERRRLFATMDQARRQGSVTWITAPPGFGKTSLATTYLAQSGCDVLWYRVDEEDADIGNFFHYLSEAGKHRLPHESGLPLFTPENLPSLAAFARRFFERLCARLQNPAALVFDDYHQVEAAAPLHAILANAAAQLPEGVHLLILSREPPPPAFARLRSYGALACIEGEALRLTQEEAHLLALRQGMRANSSKEILQLNKLADGWAAGLTLLLEHNGHLAVPEFWPSSATLQLLFDYFSYEIFAKLDPSVQDCLIKCSLLPEMPTDVVAAMTGYANAALILDQLSTSNYFTTRHDDTATVYRFHPLYRAFLLQQAEERLSHTELAAIRQQAAHHLAQRGHTEEAVALLQACERWEALAQLILAHAEQLVMQGRQQTLIAWIGRLPEALIEATPWLLFWRSACQLLFAPTLVEAKSALLRAYTLFEATQDTVGLYLSWAGIASMYYFTLPPANEALAWIVTFEALQQRYPDIPSPVIEARTALGITTLLRLYQPNHPQWSHWLSRCRGLLHTIADPNTQLLAGSELAWCYSWRGQTVEGVALLRELEPLATAPDTALLARLDWRLLTTVYAWHRFDGGCDMTAVAQALQLADESDIHFLDPYIATFGIYSALSTGDMQAAQALLPRLGSVTALPIVGVATFYQVHSLLKLHQGHFEEAVHYARQALNHIESTGIVFLRFVDHLCYGSALMEQGDLTLADTQFDHAATLVQGVDSGVMHHLLLLGQALMALKRGHTPQALDLLRGAIEKSRTIGGHYTPFYHRESLAALYALGLEANLETACLQEQIRRQRLVPNAPPVDIEAWPWRVKIYTLDRFTVILADGATLAINSKARKRPLELLKVLIAHGGREVGVQTVVDLLWTESDGDNGEVALHTTLYRLRKLLGCEQAVILNDGRLTLNAHLIWLDVWACERLMGRLDSARAERAGERMVEYSRKIGALYRRPFMQERSETWVLEQRQRLHNRFIRTLRATGDYWEQCGQWLPAVELYQRGLELDRSSEELYRRLMIAYRALGYYGEALAVYRRCCSALHTTFGITPSSVTEAVRASLPVV